MNDQRMRRILATAPRVTKEQDAEHERNFQRFMKELHSRPVRQPWPSEPRRHPFRDRDLSIGENPQLSMPGFGIVTGR